MIRASPVLLAFLIPVGLAVSEDDPFDFIPDGGRALFTVVFTDAGSQARALAQDSSAEDWEHEITNAAPTLAANQAKTLAAYLSVIAPLEISDNGLGAELPPDGRDLALTQCQSCHSLFSGYLMHRRDRAGWLATFASPFHSGIPMTDSEKEIFADYSAINMPLRFEDVPAELRF